MREVIGAAAVPVALRRGVKKSQVSVMPGFEKALFQRLVQGLRHLAGNKTAGGDRHAVLDPGGGFRGGNNWFLGHINGSFP